MLGQHRSLLHCLHLHLCYTSINQCRIWYWNGMAYYAVCYTQWNFKTCRSSVFCLFAKLCGSCEQLNSWGLWKCICWWVLLELLNRIPSSLLHFILDSQFRSKTWACLFNYSLFCSWLFHSQSSYEWSLITTLTIVSCFSKHMAKGHTLKSYLGSSDVSGFACCNALCESANIINCICCHQWNTLSYDYAQWSNLWN